MRKAGKMKENVVSFYAGEIIIALEYLHLRNIVYRVLNFIFIYQFVSKRI